jgi:hypothetical protein
MRTSSRERDQFAGHREHAEAAEELFRWNKAASRAVFPDANQFIPAPASSD